MKATFALLLLLCAGLAIWGAGESRGNEKLRARDARAQQQLSIWQAKYAEASTTVKVRVDTVRMLLPRYRTARESVLVMVTDTLRVKEFVAVADSTIKACTALANDCEAQKRASDFYVRGLQGELATARRKAERQKLLSRFGLFVGYGATRINDGTIRGGWQVGVGIRAWP